MAYNDRKVIQVLQGELDEMPDRCKDYRKELADLLGTVLLLEREHAISRTTVVKNIADQVNTMGMFLYESRAKARG